MKKFPLKSAALAIGILVASASHAAVITTVDFDATSTGVKTFAKELAYVDATPLAPAANELNFVSKLGFGVSNGQTRYIRVDYANATLDAAHSAVVGIDIDVTGTVALVQGGAIGDSYVIYQVSATSDLAATEPVAIKVPNLRVASNASPVTATYSLHETAASAQGAVPSNAALLYTKSSSIAAFGPSLVWTLGPATNTALVEQSFKKVSDGAGGSTLTRALGTAQIGATVTVLDNLGAGMTLAKLAAAGVGKNFVNFAGDFSSVAGAGTPFVASGLFLQTGGTCAAPVGLITATVNAGKTTGQADVGSTAATYDVCYTANGTAAISAQTITAALDLTPAAAAGGLGASSVADVGAATAGTIVRDGTELQAPWFSTAGGYISRFVLTSQHSADAGYTVAVITEDGNTCTTGAGASGTIKAGTQLVVNATSICSAFSGLTRAAVVFTIAAPNSKIQGVYNITNPTTGGVSVSPMVRPGTN